MAISSLGVAVAYIHIYLYIYEKSDEETTLPTCITRIASLFDAARVSTKSMRCELGILVGGFILSNE